MTKEELHDWERTRLMESSSPIPQPFNTAEIKKLFHKCWGEAHDSPDYNKRNWGDLQQALRNAGIDV